MNTSADRIPNKCTHCGLRVEVFHSADPFQVGDRIDWQFRDLQTLKKEGIVKDVPIRRISMTLGSVEPDHTEFCAVNSSAWKNPRTPCKYWSLEMKGAELADYLTLYQTKKSQEATVALSVLAIAVAVVLGIVQLSI